MERGPSARPVDPIGAKAAGAKKPPVVGRFAPTPSGRMHLGNVFSCLMAWLSAKSGGGRVVLRIEDLDPRAQDPAVADRLMADLDWLGLGWDEGPYFQSDRTELYEEAVGRLGALGLTYPCFCTRAELHAATAPHASDGTYLYAGTCRGLTAEQIAQKSLRRAPATRLRVPEAGDPAGGDRVLRPRLRPPERERVLPPPRLVGGVGTGVLPHARRLPEVLQRGTAEGEAGLDEPDAVP